jgi:hypothetical protein
MDDIKDEKPIQMIKLRDMKVTTALQPNARKLWTFAVTTTVVLFIEYFGSEYYNRTEKGCYWEQKMRMNGKR